MPRFFTCALALSLFGFSLAGAVPRTLAQQADSAPAVRTAQDEGSQQAEEFQSGRGGRGRGRGRSPAFEQSLRQSTDDRSNAIRNETPPADAAALSAGPKIPVAFDVWVLTINLPAHKAADEAARTLVAQVADLPTVVGTRDDLRSLIDKLKAAEVLQRSRQFRALGASGTASSINAGALAPQVTGSTVSGGSGGRGRAAAADGFGGVVAGGSIRNNQINYRPIGTSIQLTPQVAPNGDMQVQISFESSELEKDPEVTISESGDGLSRLMADRTTTQQIQSTLRMKSGTAVLLHSDGESSWAGGMGRPLRLVIVGAAALPTAE